MATLSDRPNTALIVIDMQNGVVADAYRRDVVVANIRSLVDAAREQAVPVVWLQHSDGQLERGSNAWQYVEELVRRESEPLVPKSYSDAFEDSDLESVLAAARVGHL
ncbi:MAG TPA: isochorismatase family protein, partial [Mycobacterium sp.]|nr:isochorismatase family protein [Mycobacterium sp.]